MANEIPKAQTYAGPVQPYQADYKGNLLQQQAFAFWSKPVLVSSDDGTKGQLYCPGFEGPTYAANPWDTVILTVPYDNPDQPQTPGIAEVSIEKYRDVDKKKAAGRDGARITVHGIEPAMIEIRLIIWTPDQLRALSVLWPVLFPKAQKGSPPVINIDHPMARLHDIDGVMFVRGDGPMPGPVPRTRVFTMRAVEFIQQTKKKATKTAVAPIGGINEPTPTPLPGKNSNNTGPTGGRRGT